MKHIDIVEAALQHVVARQRKPRNRTLDNLRRAGFDGSFRDREEQVYRVRCSCCEPLVINGVACHERFCPNIR